MKNTMPLLSWIFSVVEFAAQIIVSPFVALTAAALLVFTFLIRLYVRKGSWRTEATSWQNPPGVRLAT